MRLMLAFGAALVLLAACTNPDLSQKWRCDKQQDCGSGYVCADKVCVKEGSEADTTVVEDTSTPADTVKPPDTTITGDTQNSDTRAVPDTAEPADTTELVDTTVGEDASEQDTIETDTTTTPCTPVCEHGGLCTSPNMCDCSGTGFGGPSCETPLCTPPCENGGACTAPNTCTCDSTGYSGVSCSIPVCASPCENGGLCTAPDSCDCDGTGYDGPTCASPICSSPCANGGACVAPDTCSCDGTGYIGPTCSDAVCTTPCDHGGSCSAPNTCDCNGTGYSGATCSTPVCDPFCLNGSVCSSPGVCDCVGTGYSGTTCSTPICTMPCVNGGVCVFPDSCDCAGTDYWGSTCSNPVCEAACANGGICTAPNTCNCAGTGYDGPSCSSPSCATPCANGGVCVAPNACDCSNTGYAGTTCNTPFCSDPCENGGTCTAPNTCDCDETGYDGPTCARPTCSPTCEHEGICSAPDTCDCSGTGYEGGACAAPACQTPCSHGGTCSAPDVCDCTGTSYAGASCETPVCDPGCTNGGQCSAPNTCDCAGTGYSGTTCYEPICVLPCINGGVCAAPDTCDCSGTVFTGSSCESPILFSRTYGRSTGDEELLDSTPASDGGQFLAGRTREFGGDYDMLATRIDRAGQVTWAKAYGGPADDWAHAVALTSWGSVVVAGTTRSYGAGSYDAWLVSLDSNGQITWQQAYGSSGDEIFYSVCETTNGQLVAAGLSSNGVWVMATSSDGQLIWEKAFGGDRTYSVIPTDDGGTLVAGFATLGAGQGSSDGWLIKLDGDGQVDWQELIGANGDDKFNRAAQLEDGGYMVGGWSHAETDYSWVLRLNSQGVLDWSELIGRPDGHEVVSDLLPMPSGGFLLGTLIFPSLYTLDGRDFGLMKLDHAGNVSWQRRYGGDGIEDTISIVSADADRIVFSGSTQSSGAGGSNLWLMQVDGSGASADTCPGDYGISTAASAGPFQVTVTATTAVGTSTSPQITTTTVSPVDVNQTTDTICSSDAVCNIPCENGGTCVGLDTCECSSTGFGGESCDEPTCVPCPNGFACSNDTTCEDYETGEVWVPAGTFWMGCNSVLDSHCRVNEFEQHEVALTAYAIDKTEVTASEYKACVDAGACTTAGSGANSTYDVSGKESHPVNYVNWYQAVEYCAWSGKAAGVQRLCTEAEWERAARGGCEKVEGDCKTGMRTYPWGEAPPTASLANFYNKVGSTTAVGTYSPAGDSAYGVQDMAGNVWDWVSDWLAESYAATAVIDPTGANSPDSGTNRVKRGGAFNSPATYLRASQRGGDGPTGSLSIYGIRCCRSTP